MAALPIWIGYMQKALEGHARSARCRCPTASSPCGSTAETGLRDEAGTLSEYFFAEFPPRSRDDSLAPAGAAGQPGRDIRDQLF